MRTSTTISCVACFAGDQKRISFGVQDIGLSGADDATVLEWAAAEDRILLTHDVTAMSHLAYQRIRVGRRMSGIFEVSRSTPVGSVIEDILLLDECSLEDEWEGQVRYLPLR